MLYRETGEFHVRYRDDQRIFPIRQDRRAFAAGLAVAFAAVPFLVNDYWLNAILLPILVYALAAIGLNILVGYCGQLSLGTGGFMAVGAYATYKLMTSFPDLNILLIVILAGLVTAAVGMLFGIPSLRIKGFYLAVATLAAQFFFVWLFTRVPWFFNHSPTGQITSPERTVLGVSVTGAAAPPWASYLFCLSIVTLFALAARNLVRGRVGRSWQAIRDRDIAAEIIGVDPLRAKLSAFAVSSFYVGMAGSLYFAVWLGAAVPSEAFGIDRSFLVLFMIIIGGLGTMMGSFLGAAFMVATPILLKAILVDGFGLLAVTAKHIEVTLFGALIIFFLIVEPHGLARLWAILKEKLRRWPFPN